MASAVLVVKARQPGSVMPLIVLGWVEIIKDRVRDKLWVESQDLKSEGSQLVDHLVLRSEEAEMVVADQVLLWIVCPSAKI